MNINNFIDGLPDEIQAVLGKYLPAIQAMAESEILSLADYIARGKTVNAVTMIAAKMANTDLLAAIGVLNSDTAIANEANTSQVAAQKEAVADILRVLVSFALSALAAQLTEGDN